MSREALLRFLVLGGLCCTLVLTTEALKSPNVANAETQQPTKKMAVPNNKKSESDLEDDEEESDDSVDEPNCSSEPVCPLGFSLFKTDELDREGCAMFQCIELRPQIQSSNLQATERITPINCTLAVCPKGFRVKLSPSPKTKRSSLNLFTFLGSFLFGDRKLLKHCPRASCERIPWYGGWKWKNCELLENSIQTFDGQSLNCVKACKVNLINGKEKRVELIKSCWKGKCQRKVRVFLKRASIRFILTLSRKHEITIQNLIVRGNYTKPIGKIKTFKTKKLSTIREEYPFFATTSGDTMIFTAYRWGLRVIWNKFMQGSVQIRDDVGQKSPLGACNFAAGIKLTRVESRNKQSGKDKLTAEPKGGGKKIFNWRGGNDIFKWEKSSGEGRKPAGKKRGKNQGVGLQRKTKKGKKDLFDQSSSSSRKTKSRRAGSRKKEVSKVGNKTGKRGKFKQKSRPGGKGRRGKKQKERSVLSYLRSFILRKKRGNWRKVSGGGSTQTYILKQNPEKKSKKEKNNRRSVGDGRRDKKKIKRPGSKPDGWRLLKNPKKGETGKPKIKIIKKKDQKYIDLNGKLKKITHIKTTKGGEIAGSIYIKATSTRQHLRKWSSGNCDRQRCRESYRLQSWKMCQYIRNKPFNYCKGVMSACNFETRCEEAACRCLEAGEKLKTCKCSVLTMFAKECLLRKLSLKTLLQDGLNKHKCTPACGKEFVYNLCIKKSCQRKCSNLKKFKCPEVKEMCASGCHCPSGLVMKDKRCVRKPQCRNCKCSGSTDGTHETFDKQSFSFKGNCTYMALRDKKSHMKVFVTYKNCHGKSRGISKCYLFVRIWAVNEKEIAIYKGKNSVRAYVSGNQYRIPYRSKQVRMRRIKGGVAILYKAIQLEVLVFQDLDNPYVQNFEINIPRELYKETKDRTEGLCGVCAGPGSKRTTLRLKVRGKSNSGNIKKYTDSWLAKYIAYQFKHELNCGVKPPPVCKHTDRQNRKICGKLSTLKKSIFKKCHIKIDPFIKKCQRLICSKKTWKEKTTFGCKIISEYAAKCCASGKKIENWRYLAKCPRIRCKQGTGKSYQVCGPGCDKTCKRKKCSPTIRNAEGCYCKTNQRWNGTNCIWKSKCPICKGHVLGERWTDLQSCQKCHCRAGGKIVCRRLCQSKKKCKWDQKLSNNKKYGKCCRVCVCKKPCPRAGRLKCKRLGEIPIIYKSKLCKCLYYKCKCVKRTCLPKPRCTKYQLLNVYKKRENCCKTYKCICIGSNKCPKRRKPICLWDQKIVKYYDKSKCCVTSYKCRCAGCKTVPLPKCRSDQKLRRVPSLCKCIKFTCKCKSCPKPPICGIYAKHIRIKLKNRCCPTYDCKCVHSTCPRVMKIIKKCMKGLVLKKVYDHRNCCLLRYSCKCKKCTTTKKKKCRKDQKSVLSKTLCRCNKYSCVCNKMRCPRIPKCTKYQYRREVKGGTKPCCRLYECVCIPLPKCPKVNKPRCPEFKKIKKIVDPNQCCVIKKECTCAGVKCPRYYKSCGKYQKQQFVKSRCGCRKMNCICAKEKCPRVTCTKYQRMITNAGKVGCCPRRYCACIFWWKCPRIKTGYPICKPGKEAKPIRDKHNCCLIYYKCVCKPCYKLKLLRCKSSEVRVSKKYGCGCIINRCVCDSTKCPKKPRTCGKYGKLTTYRAGKRSCCKKYKCECEKRKCPRRPKRKGPKCVDEQVIRPVIDKTKCCVKYYVCRCKKPLRCKRFSKKYCGVGEKLETRKSACGCKRPICVCHGSTLCPSRPKCGTYQVLKKLKIKSNKCCTVYTCVCRKRSRCPRLINVSCNNGRVQHEKYDTKGCCIVKKYCKCGSCPIIKKPKCQKHMRLQNQPTTCCNYYKCVCNRASCPVLNCTKHQLISETKVSDRCCPMQRCVCDPKRCPVQKLKSQKDCPNGRVIKTRWSKDRCCLLYYCACPKCPPIRPSRCGIVQKLLRVPLPCGCAKYRCVCDKKKCSKQKPCKYYQKRVLISILYKCCRRYKCICDKTRCKQVLPNPKKCKAEQKLVPVLDPSKCCTLRYKCECGKCPQRKTPPCQKYEKVKVSRSRCGCRKPTCICNKNIQCPAIPRCSKLQKLEVTKSYRCCKRYKCICKGASFCPAIKTPRCKDEEVIKAIYDENNCCEVRRDCVCPKGSCSSLHLPRCGKYQKRKMIKTACCNKYRCVCDRKQCLGKKCSKYETLVKTPTPGCCPNLTCICDGKKCPGNVKTSICPKGKKLISLTDNKKCCILRYRCVCLKCPREIPKIKCKKRQKVIYKLTKCQCRVPTCVCDKNRCPPKKKCGKYLVLKSKKYEGACCHSYFCECKQNLCPRALRPRCGSDKMAVPVFDSSNCCVIKYKCKCKKCKRYNKKPCESYEKTAYRTTNCGCRIPRCVCNHTIVCPAAPKCKQYEILKNTRTSNKCCKRYECVCKGLRYCRRIKRPKCSKEEKVVTVKGKCCIKDRYCKCKKCPPAKVPKCNRFQSLKLKPSKCCSAFRCVCDKSRCPDKKCPKYLKKISIPLWRKCCPQQKCVCKPQTCPKRARKTKCGRDYDLAFKYEKNNCCKIFYCKCRPCKYFRKIRCKKSQKVELKTTPCGCREYKCVCDKYRCKPKPRCSKYTRLTVLQEAKKCCPTYQCRCINREKCPKVKADISKCKDEQYLKPVYDSSHCCVKQWKCVCSTCKPITIPPCENYQRVEYDESVCHCPKPKCVCNDTIRCQPKPICTKYQVLRASNTSDPCCERHECVCKGLSECPSVPTPNCEGEEYVADVSDNNNCCVVKRICKCPKKCPNIKTPKCKKGSRIVTKETKCCFERKCVCDINKCKRKRCGKCMFAVSLKIRKGCCPVETCACNATCCQPVKLDSSKCKEGQNLKAVRDEANCCITKYICDCINCKLPPVPACKKNHKLVRRFTVCRCLAYNCVCNPKSCPRQPTCGKYESMVSKLRSGGCCMRYSCRCNKKKCPSLKFDPKKCRDEQKLVSVTDRKKCCTTSFKCKCQKCTPPKKIKCGKFKKVQMKKTVCGCPKPECICSKAKCPRMPNCSKFQEMRTYNTSKCCYTHKCVCKSLDNCPKVKTPNCKDEEKVVTKLDKNKCCIIQKKCKCPKRCPKQKKLKCKKTQRIIQKETKCCMKPKCVCAEDKCKRRPKCAQFKKLKKYKIKGKCCPQYKCLPPNGCVVMDKETEQYLLKKKNSTWKENACRTCKCEKPAGGFEAKCTDKKCQKCPKTHKVVMIKGRCCPKCAPKGCVIGKVVLKLGLQWSIKCLNFKCIKKLGRYIIEVSRKSCPLVTICDKKSPGKDECQCGTCIFPKCYKTTPITPAASVGYVKVKDTKGKTCTNKGKIYGLAKCKGVCGYITRKKSDKRLIKKECRMAKSKTIAVKLTCPGGKTMIHYYRSPVTCTCKSVCKCQP